MRVREESTETLGEVHGAKNNEVRETTNKSSQACARARVGDRPVSGILVDAGEVHGVVNK
jgi:hypothetical protein